MGKPCSQKCDQLTPIDKYYRFCRRFALLSSDLHMHCHSSGFVSLLTVSTVQYEGVVSPRIEQDIS